MSNCAEPLVTRYDVAMLDLDGVVYVGADAVPGAAGHLERFEAGGARVAFVTNNASRPPREVAAHLNALGVRAEVGDVVTSAQAAAALLADRSADGTRVALLGGPGLGEALREVGLEPVGVDEDAAAVVTGYGPDLRWRDITRVAARIRSGLPWVACNTDGSFPTSFGLAPGHGVLVDMLQRFTGATPVVAGKPQRALLDETVRRLAATRPLMVGDRLDTDIEGAVNAQIDSLLVLTGVTGLTELVAAPPGARPSYLSVDLGGLLTAHPAPSIDGDRCLLGGWSSEVVDGRLHIAGIGEPEDWWRVAATSAWRHLDAHATPVDVTGLMIPETATHGR